MILERIQEAHKMGRLDLTLRGFKEFASAVSNALIRQYFERSDDSAPEVWNRPSGGPCFRKKEAIKHSVPYEKGLPFQAVSRYWMGDMVEAWFATMAKAAGVGMFGTLEDQYTIPTDLGDGHPDGFNQDNPKLLAQGKAEELWENKGSAAFAWGKFNREVVDGGSVMQLDNVFGYREQVISYGLAAMKRGVLLEPKVRFTYISFEDSWKDKCKALDVSEKLLYLDKDCSSFMEELRDSNLRVATSEKPWLEPTLPLSEGGKLSLTCNYCPFAKPCWEAAGYQLTPLGGNKRGWRVL